LYVSGIYYDSSFAVTTNIYASVYIGSTGILNTEVGIAKPTAMSTLFSQGISYSGTQIGSCLDDIGFSSSFGIFI
jgi:hypothetical protein